MSKNSDHIAQLEQQVLDLTAANTTLTEQVAALTTEKAQLIEKLAAVPTATPKNSKSLEQATAAMELLTKNGVVTLPELAAINPKYPTDPVYHARQLLKASIVTARAANGKTVYFTPEAHAKFMEGQKKEAVAAAEAPKTEQPTPEAAAPAAETVNAPAAA